jgi:hypothetical protein
MSVPEIGALLDAHDMLLGACLDGSLSLQEFVAAYGQFPRGYALDIPDAGGQAPEAMELYRKRIAFHRDVAKVVASVSGGPIPDLGLSDDLAATDDGGFMARAVILRLRQLVARHPGFTAQLS